MRTTQTNTNRTVDVLKMFCDVAHMMYMKDVHQEMIKDQYVLFPLADASSLKVGNAMMAEYFFIKGKDSLLRAGAAAMLLKAVCVGHRELDEHILEASLLHNRVIESVSGHHVWPITFLGQKKSNLAHKLHSFIHKVRLESHSWKDAADFINLFFCWVTDTGTEKKFRRTRVSVQSWFSWWQDTTLLHAPHDAGIMLDAPQAGDDLYIDMTKSLGIRGCMHTVNKLQELVLSHFGKWESHCKAFLTSLCIYFNNGELRKEFSEEGLRRKGGNDVWSAYHCLFDVGPPQIKGGRVWHVLSKVREWLCPERILVIRSWWPWADHLHVENDDLDEGATDNYARLVGRHRANVSRVVSSSDTWGFVTMLFHLVELIGHLENWFRSCPCHSHELVQALAVQKCLCNLRGCRAVCCATGEIDLMLRQITTASEHDLSQKLPIDMSAAARSEVIREFNWSKNIIFTHAFLRFKEWR